MATPSFVLSSDDVAKTPPGVSQVPLSVKFSPDGSLLTYLFPNHQGVRQVYAVDLTKKEEGYVPYKLFDATTAGSGTDSLAEQLRKERMRLFVNGISQYEWTTPLEENHSTRRIMLPLHGSVLLYENNPKENPIAGVTSTSPLQVLYDSTSTGESAVDPQLSPKGNAVAFVLNDDLYVQYLSSSTSLPPSPPIRITTNGNQSGISCGVADFIAQEEMDRYHGFWWSPCGTMLVYTEVNENHVPTFDILHQGKADPHHVETHRYPFAGQPNPLVKLAVAFLPPPPVALPPPVPAPIERTSNILSQSTVTMNDGADGITVKWLELVPPSPPSPSLADKPSVTPPSSTLQHSGTSSSSSPPMEIPSHPHLTHDNGHIDPEDFYIARVGWWPDGSIMIQIQNRRQTLLQLLRMDPKTGQREVLLEERSDVWINLHDMCHPIPSSSSSSTTTTTDNNRAGAAISSGFQFLWASERSGYRQLYLYQYTSAGSTTYSDTVSGSGGGNNNTGSSSSTTNISSGGGSSGSSTGHGAITCLHNGQPIGGGGTWIVESIEAIDVERGLVYFSGNPGNHTEKHLFVASYVDGGDGRGSSREGNSTRGGGGGDSTVAMKTGEEGVTAKGGNGGGLFQRLTLEPGWHMTTVNTTTKVFVDVFSAVNRPPITRLYSLSYNHNHNNNMTAPSSSSGATMSSSSSTICQYDHPTLLAILHDSGDDPRLSTMLPVLSVPRFDKIPLSSDTTENGVGDGTGETMDIGEGVEVGTGMMMGEKDATTGIRTHTTSPHSEAGGLHCAMYLPNPEIHGPGPYPTIVSVYGGPGPQRVSNMWSLRVDLRAQRLAQHYGYAVLRCDNRGSARRGLQFERSIKWQMGDVELADQVTALRWYAEQGLVDMSKVGMFGWSYGGYLSAMSICRPPYCDVFRCAVAGAPVTSWDGYDTHYTERYMGLPQENPQGYLRSAVMSHIPHMPSSNRLMLVHGLIDENVHFRHTARLINALIGHRKLYDLVLFPCERHAPHKHEDRAYLEDRMMSFFQDNLHTPTGSSSSSRAIGGNGNVSMQSTMMSGSSPRHSHHQNASNNSDSTTNNNHSTTGNGISSSSSPLGVDSSSSSNPAGTNHLPARL